jgi:DNA modification methylase
MENKIIHTDALSLLDSLVENGIKSRLIITDPPYGTTLLALEKGAPSFEDMAKNILKVLDVHGWFFLFGTVEMAKVFLDYFRLKFYYIWLKPNFAPISHNTVRPPMVTELIFAFVHPDLKRPSKLTFHPEELRTTGHQPYRAAKGPKLTEYTKTQGCFGSWIESYAGDETRKGTNVLKFPNKTGMKLKERTEHPTQKPLDLVKTLIQGYSNPGDLIIDPFAGSGTTLVAAKELNRKYIVSEITEKYVKICQKRLE